tara:strand:- start:15344 stop:15916 length:573 start_codon:yes stop_codon:yes gene_type:complete
MNSTDLANIPADPQFILEPDDLRYNEVAKLLAVGCMPMEAICTAGFDLPSGQTPDEKYELTQEDWEYANAIANYPAVQQLFRAIADNSTEKYAVSIEEKRALLRAAMMTPLSAVTADSILCIEYEETETEDKHGKSTFKRKVKKIDPLRAMDMDNKLAGHYAAEKVDVGAEGLMDVVQRIRNAANPTLNQ